MNVLLPPRSRLRWRRKAFAGFGLLLAAIFVVARAPCYDNNI